METMQAVLTSLLAAAISALGGWLIVLAISSFRNRHERWFWGRFYKRRLHIGMREYWIDASSPEERIAKSVGDGYEVTKGMALAMNRVVSFCQARVTARDLISVSGDQSASWERETESPICLGSKNNAWTRQVLDEVAERYALPFDTRWDPDSKHISITYTNHPSAELQPTVEAGSGTDYALVVVADLEHGPALVIAGAHMWGTQGAAEALTSRAWLAKFRSKLSRASHFAFVLKVAVEKNVPTTSEVIYPVALGERM